MRVPAHLIEWTWLEKDRLAVALVMHMRQRARVLVGPDDIVWLDEKLNDAKDDPHGSYRQWLLDEHCARRTTP